MSTYTSNFVKRYCISINIDVLDQLTTPGMLILTFVIVKIFPYPL